MHNFSLLYSVPLTASVANFELSPERSSLSKGLQTTPRRFNSQPTSFGELALLGTFLLGFFKSYPASLDMYPHNCTASSIKVSNGGLYNLSKTTPNHQAASSPLCQEPWGRGGLKMKEAHSPDPGWRVLNLWAAYYKTRFSHREAPMAMCWRWGGEGALTWAKTHALWVCLCMSWYVHEHSCACMCVCVLWGGLQSPMGKKWLHWNPYSEHLPSNWTTPNSISRFSVQGSGDPNSHNPLILLTHNP